MMTARVSEGNCVNFLYPVHGNRNILRTVSGVIEEKGNGENGRFLTIREGRRKARTFSYAKIVNLQKVEV